MNIEFIFPMRMLHWWVLGTVLALAVVYLALRLYERRRRVRLDRMVQAHLAPRLHQGVDAASRGPLIWLPILGLFFLSLALAQPHWGQSWRTVTKQARDVIICLDTSESMRAAAVSSTPHGSPSRLDRAKLKIASLLDMAVGDRFGLVVFAGEAQLISPLTVDHGYYRSVLNAVTTDTLSEKGTDIAEALMEAVRAFKQEDAKTRSFDRDYRAILLISDGEAVTGDALKAAETAAAYACIYVIGVGDPQGDIIEIPQWMATYAGQRYGSTTHLSRLDEDTLTKVALLGKGGYTRSTADNADIGRVFGLMEELASRATSGELHQRLVNRYQWPLMLAIVCFVAEGIWLVLMPWMRKRRLARHAPAAGERQYA
jgi:Ca-activated chloride channel homolog